MKAKGYIFGIVVVLLFILCTALAFSTTTTITTTTTIMPATTTTYLVTTTTYTATTTTYTTTTTVSNSGQKTPGSTSSSSGVSSEDRVAEWKEKQLKLNADKIKTEKEQFIGPCQEDSECSYTEDEINRIADEVSEQRELHTSDIVGAFLSPSMGEQVIGNWLQEKLFGKADFTQNWRNKDKFLTAMDPVSTVSDWFCAKKESEFFKQSGPNRYISNTGWPSEGQYMFIYGKRQEYATADGTPLYDWPSGDKWFPFPNGTPAGYLYTYSWSFNHPFSQEEVDSMSEGKRAELGLSKKTGKIFYRIVFVDGDGKMTKGVRWNVTPGGVAKYTVSLYSKKDNRAVCIKFLGIQGGQGSYYYPDNCVPLETMGTIKTSSSSVYGTVVSPFNPNIDTGEATHFDDDGNPITIGGDEGTLDEDDGNGGSGDYGGII